MNLLKGVSVLTSLVKIPYYPHVEATMKETNFGAIEITCPQIYETAIKGKVIVRIDLLECLRPIWGDDCQICRGLLYQLVSGSCPDDVHKKLFASFYRKYKNITIYVNNHYNYGETTIPIVERTLHPIRNIINSYKDDIDEMMSSSGGKYLTTTHDYIYYAFVPGSELPDIKGAKIIC